MCRLSVVGCVLLRTFVLYNIRACLRMSGKSSNFAAFFNKVNPLKSNSRNIGATALGDFAEVMEHAGKAGDKAFIKDNHEKLLQMVSEVVAEANSILE